MLTHFFFFFHNGGELILFKWYPFGPDVPAVQNIWCMPFFLFVLPSVQ